MVIATHERAWLTTAEREEAEAVREAIEVQRAVREHQSQRTAGAAAWTRERIAAEPAAWMGEALGADLWQKQTEIAQAVRDYRRVAVKSCHGSGKSFLAARIAVWFLHAHKNSLVITTAPTFNQVKNILWREIRRVYSSAKAPLLGRCLQTSVEIDANWYALGFKADDASPDAFQGFHSEQILVIIDEAAGVAETVFDALDAMMSSSDARMLLIGNPTSDSGTFRDAFNRSRALYHTITITAPETPNLTAGETVRPYLVTQTWVDEAITKYGEDSPYVQARVHANFPDTVSGSLIPLSQIEAAAARTLEPSNPDLLSVDVARYGEDETVIVHRRGPVARLHTLSRQEGTMETAGRVVRALEETGADEARIDGVGIGGGTVDRLDELDQPYVDMQAGAAASDSEHYLNQRAEWYWGLRERFKAGDIDIDDDQELIAQLSSIRYKFTSRGQVQIESKEDAKKRGVSSPDRADALAMAFASPAEKYGGWMTYIQRDKERRRHATVQAS